MKFGAIVDISNFSIEELDISEIMKLGRVLPKSGTIDTGIAEKYLLLTIEAQDMCQEKISQVDKYIGIKKIYLDKTEAESALLRAKDAGHKTAKEREWFTQSDELVINFRKELEIAKVCKSWLENKVKYFSMWHYSLKSFLARDNGILMANGGNYTVPDYDDLESTPNKIKNVKLSEDIAGDINWSE
jgi:hypothetical protein